MAERLKCLLSKPANWSVISRIHIKVKEYGIQLSSDHPMFTPIYNVHIHKNSLKLCRDTPIILRIYKHQFLILWLCCTIFIILSKIYFSLDYNFIQCQDCICFFDPNTTSQLSCIWQIHFNQSGWGNIWYWGCNSVVDHLYKMFTALYSIPSITEKGIKNMYFSITWTWWNRISCTPSY